MSRCWRFCLYIRFVITIDGFFSKYLKRDFIIMCIAYQYNDVVSCLYMYACNIILVTIFFY